MNSTFFWCNFGVWKRYKASYRSTYQAARRRSSYRIKFLQHITKRSGNGSLLLHRRNGDVTLKRRFPRFSFSSSGIHFLSFLEFPLFQMLRNSLDTYNGLCCKFLKRCVVFSSTKFFNLLSSVVERHSYCSSTSRQSSP